MNHYGPVETLYVPELNGSMTAEAVEALYGPIIKGHEHQPVPVRSRDLRDLPPGDLAANDDAARIVGRLTRKGQTKSKEPVKFTAFNSRI